MAARRRREGRLVKDKRAHIAPGPAVVLVEPQMGENIGAAARAMLNFGLTRLRLVAPRDGWPNPKAQAMSSGASVVVDDARVFETTREALSDCAYVLATTARKREMFKPVLEPEEAARELSARVGRGENCAILFGGERAGLGTEDVAQADAIVLIPVNPAFSSLNLAQAVIVVAYEWSKASRETLGLERPASELDAATPASRADLEGLFGHLESELDAAGYFHPPEKRPVMARTIRTALTRAQLTEPETRTLRGVVKALAKGRGGRG